MLAPSRLPLLAALAAVLGPAACKDKDKDPAPAPAPPASSQPALSSSAPLPPAPIDAALPTATPPPFDRRSACAKGTCTLAHLVPDEVRPALSDGAPVVLWEQAIGERASLIFPRDEGVELLGVVLDGDLDLTPMDAPKVRAVGGRWTGFRAPGGGVTLGGTGGKAVRLALVVALVEPGVGLGAHLDRRDRPGAPLSWSWKVRQKRIDLVVFADRPDVVWGGGAYHARIGWEASTYRFGDSGGKGGWEVDDRPAAVVDLVRYSANARLAEQVHPHTWESLAVIEGDGTMVRGEERTEVRPGTIVTLAAGTRSAWTPSGKAPFFALQVYAPPGPERRFKSLPGEGSVPPSPG
jgi:mannose-6-phosphate isomerase-like protein (cupin superfamily)